jgi:hypothetical protein
MTIKKHLLIFTLSLAVNVIALTYRNIKNNGLTTNLTILNIGLLLNRAIDEYANNFSSIRAGDIAFLKLVHQ